MMKMTLRNRKKTDDDLGDDEDLDDDLDDDDLDADDGSRDL
jgi:hypothetical protein